MRLSIPRCAVHDWQVYWRHSSGGGFLAQVGGRSVSMMSSTNGARWWKLALPIALFVPLVAGCGGQSPGAGTTAAPMRVAAPAQWRRVNPPPGASKLASLAVSPVNGADAWDCESVDPY